MVERAATVLFVAAYGAAIVSLVMFARPLSRGAFVAVAVLPAVMAFLSGIPKVLRSKPRGLMAVFHLGIYPALAAIALGLPGVFIAWQLAKFLEA
jgi:hypothetical protein